MYISENNGNLTCSELHTKLNLFSIKKYKKNCILKGSKSNNPNRMKNGTTLQKYPGHFKIKFLLAPNQKISTHVKYFGCLKFFQVQNFQIFGLKKFQTFSKYCLPRIFSRLFQDESFLAPKRK